MMNSKGFTIIEVLVSMLLLSVCMAGGIRLFMHADQITALSIHKRVANELINSSLEDLRNTDYDSITTSTTGTFITSVYSVGGLSCTQSISVALVDDNGDPATPPFDTMKRVTINVNWGEAQENGVTRDYNFVTYIAKPKPVI